MSQRGDEQLIAAIADEPRVGDPPADLDAAVRQAWFDIVAATPIVLRVRHASWLRMTAMGLVVWRDACVVAAKVTSRELEDVARDRGLMLDQYRDLGRLFVPMRARRALLFPDRPPRRSLS